MARKRRVFSSAFKAKVALEAVKEQRTMAELSAKHEIHSTQIQLWKKQLTEGAEGLFEQAGGKRGKSAGDDEPQVAELYEQIGRLKVQLEWFKKKVAQDGE